MLFLWIRFCRNRVAQSAGPGGQDRLVVMDWIFLAVAGLGVVARIHVVKEHQVGAELVKFDAARGDVQADAGDAEAVRRSQLVAPPALAVAVLADGPLHAEALEQRCHGLHPRVRLRLGLGDVQHEAAGEFRPDADATEFPGGGLGPAARPGFHAGARLDAGGQCVEPLPEPDVPLGEREGRDVREVLRQPVAPGEVTAGQGVAG